MIEILKSTNGLYTIKKDGVFLLSSYDPLREVKRFVEKLSIKEDEFLILFGSGAGHLLNELSKYEVYVFFPIEEEKKLISSKFNEVTGENILQIIEEKLTNSKKPRIITLESYKKAFSDKYKEFEEMIIFNTKMAIENVKVTSFFIKVWFFNLLRNLLVGIKNNYLYLDISEKIDKDILICAAGPSLNEQLLFIKKERKNFILFSVLSAVETLISNDIIPDIIAITDGGVANKFYTIDLPEDVLVIADVYASSSFISTIKNKVIFYNFLDEIKNPTFYLTNPSVSITAGKIAKMLTNGNIIYTGFDLAYSMKIGSHSYPGVFTNPCSKRFNRLFKIENYLFSFLKRNDLIIKDIVTNKQFELVARNIKEDYYYLYNKIGIPFLKPFKTFSKGIKNLKLNAYPIKDRKDEILTLLDKISHNSNEKLLMKERLKNINVDHTIIQNKIDKFINNIRTQLQH